MHYDLSLEETVVLAQVKSELGLYPESLLKRLKFALNSSQTMDAQGIVAAAYFGSYIIPGSYELLIDKADEICRRLAKKGNPYAISTLALRSRGKQKYHEELLKDFGFSEASPESVKAFYAQLDAIAKAHGFQNFLRVSEPVSYIDYQRRSGSANFPFPKGKGSTEIAIFKRYAAFMWDIYCMTQAHELPDVSLEVFENELLFMHALDDTVYARLIGCDGYRKGVDKAINPAIHCVTSINTDGMQQVSQRKFPGYAFKFINL